MSNKGKKLEPKLGLDMSFDEALERFIHTDPAEVEASIKRSKQKKPPDGKKPKRKQSSGTSQSDTVVDLRHRRMRKRNQGR